MTSKKNIRIFIVALVYAAFAFILWPFKQPIIFAALFAFALNPLITKLKSIKKMKLSDLQAISILVVGLFGVLFLPLNIIVIRIAKMVSHLDADQINEMPFFQKATDAAHYVFDYVNSIIQNFGVDLSSQANFKGMGADLAKNALAVGSTVLADIPSAIFNFLVFIAMLYYFLLNKKELRNTLDKARIFTDQQIQQLCDLLQDVCNLVLISTIIVAFAQAIIVGLASFIVGLEGSLIIFLIAFFMAFLPVVGTAPITSVLIIYSAVNGNYGSAVVLAVAAVLAGTVDNVIRTYLFSSKEDSVSPVISLLTIIGSLSVFGILGLFLGPIIAELAVKIGKIIYEE